MAKRTASGASADTEEQHRQRGQAADEEDLPGREAQDFAEDPEDSRRRNMPEKVRKLLGGQDGAARLRRRTVLQEGLQRHVVKAGAEAQGEAAPGSTRCSRRRAGRRAGRRRRAARCCRPCPRRPRGPCPTRSCPPTRRRPGALPAPTPTASTASREPTYCCGHAEFVGSQAIDVHLAAAARNQ